MQGSACHFTDAQSTSAASLGANSSLAFGPGGVSATKDCWIVGHESSFANQPKSAGADWHQVDMPERESTGQVNAEFAPSHLCRVFPLDSLDGQRVAIIIRPSPAFARTLSQNPAGSPAAG